VPDLSDQVDLRLNISEIWMINDRGAISAAFEHLSGKEFLGTSTARQFS